MMRTTTVRVSHECLAKLGEIAELVGMSRNKLIEMALMQYVAEYGRRQIDQEFEGMAHDSRYQRMSLEICEAFKYSDAEVKP